MPGFGQGPPRPPGQLTWSFLPFAIFRLLFFSIAATDWGRCAGNKLARGRCWLGQFGDLGDGWSGNLAMAGKSA